MQTFSGIPTGKLRTPTGGDNEDDHAAYVRAEWKKFRQSGAPLQRFAAKLKPAPRSVLDIGCGAGQELLPYLDTLAVGVDSRRSGLEAGRSLFGARAPLLLVADAEALPFRTAGFDVVLCRLALPYMDVRAALAEMSRVLAPDGALVLQVHHFRYYLRRAAEGVRGAIHALRVIARGAWFELTGRQPRGEVFQRLRSLRRMLEAAGLSVVEIDETDRRAPIVVARRVLARPAGRRV